MTKPRNFRYFAEQIWAGGAPNLDQMSDIIREKKIRNVLSLDRASAALLSPLLKQSKVNQIMVPIDPVAYPTDNLKYLIRNIRQIMTKQPIYVHCSLGQDRTGFALALYRVLKYNYSADNAIAEAKRFGYGSGINQATQNFYNSILKKAFETKNPQALADNLAQETTEEDQASADDSGWTGPYTLPYPNGSINERNNGYPYQESSPSNLEMLEQINQGQVQKATFPSVGAFNVMGPIKGTGPVENSGIMFNW